MHGWIQSVEAGGESGGKVTCLPDPEESKHRELESWPRELESKDRELESWPKESKGSKWSGQASL